ncbi:remorin-like, partial [Zingiber officinale]|uniref:remorin-like n=1 Tax=Zingiber officinale TaxID=94328 RepID=UPI001C4AF263
KSPILKKMPDYSKALSIVEQAEDEPKEEGSGGSIERDAVLSRLATEKKLSLIKAWEDNEKTKTENKALKKLSAIAAWENSRKAAVEAELKRKEEDLGKQKAEFTEKVKNKIVLLHKTAEEKRAIVAARHGEEMLRAEELATNHRATGLVPNKFLGCFGT